MSADSSPAPGPRYPVWLGFASFVWAVVGWVLAASAPSLAFVPGIEVLHLVLPSVTVLLILGNLAFSLYALFRRKVPIGRLLLVTGLQIGLFTTLFFQFAAHIGAECYWIQRPIRSWDWIQFSIAHAIRASDVLDTIEAFGWKIQVIKHRSPFVGAFVVAYHVVIDLFMLGLFWAMLNRLKKRLMEHSNRAAAIRKIGAIVFLVWFGVWLHYALYVRPWRRIDIPLWFVENLVRVLDFGDAMDSFDIHWHQVPKEPLESTLTFFCRFWIATGVSILLDWRTAHDKVRPLDVQNEPAAVGSIRRLGIAAALLVALIGADSLLATRNQEQIAELTAIASGNEQDRAGQALAALRRIGPNAQDAIKPLAEAYARFPDRREMFLEALGHLGPNAADPLRDLVLKADASEAEAAVMSLRQIGPRTAPTLAAVWSETGVEQVKACADATLRECGLDAMPYLIEATDPINSAVHCHWFDELDRNWTLRGTDNRTVLALKKLQKEGELARALGHSKVPDWVSDCGTGAIPHLVTVLTYRTARSQKELLRGDDGVLVFRPLADERAHVREAAARALGEFGPRAREAVPVLVKVLANEDMRIREAALRALRGIALGIKETVPNLADAQERKKWPVREAAGEALRKIGPCAIPDLVKALSDKDGSVRQAAAVGLERIGPGAKEALAALAIQAKDDDYFPAKKAAESAIGQIRGK